eukprot:1178653-Prorocentrum_minimum.AAC.1
MPPDRGDPSRIRGLCPDEGTEYFGHSGGCAVQSPKSRAIRAPPGAQGPAAPRGASRAGGGARPAEHNMLST